MITGVHALVYSKAAEELRAFFRDKLDFPFVDAGHGWLIFALPPAEIAAHPIDEGEGSRHELYLMCDDVHATVAELKRKGVGIRGAIEDQGWGLLTSIELPGGDTIGLYQPKHPVAAGRTS